MRRKKSGRFLALALAAAVGLTELSGTGVISNSLVAQAAEAITLKSWNFDDGIGSWSYNSGWDYQYTGTANTALSAEDGKIKLDIDFSQDGDKSWSQLAFGEWGNVAIAGANQMTLDLYYDSAKLNGSFSMKTVIQYADGGEYPSAVEETASVDTSEAETVEGTMKKTKVTFRFDPITQEECCNVMLMMVGQNTTYQGSVYIDDVVISGAEAEDVYIDSTKRAEDSTALSISNQKLNSYNSEGAAVTTDIAATAKLADKNADADTTALYAYLEALGNSDSVIFGHQNDTWHKAGSASLSNSDTVDVTGSISGVVGIDTLSLTGNEYSASRYNSEIGDQTFPETSAGNVAAAAALTNQVIGEGAIVTLSSHTPNFSLVQESAAYDEDTDPSYAKYDFSGYSPNTLSGDPINEILPGGEYNQIYTAFLDMIADYAHQVNGTILFRPFHENTGSWFWWGAAFCDAQTYKNVYKYTVEYLRDEQNVHNMLYEYGPGSEASSVEEYAVRYPGDDYVDILGFDMYHSNPQDGDTWFDSFKTELAIVEQFGEAHGKLIAVTETGVANAADKGDNQTALHKTGNQQLDWYNDMLEAVSGSSASYFLLWANFGEKDGFYTPYVKSVNEDGSLHGHEEMDYFIDFYNDARSIFAVNQKDTLASLKDTIQVTAEGTASTATGYITAPVSGRQILKAASLAANVTGLAAGETVKFVAEGEETVEIPAVLAEGSTKRYVAELTAENLAVLGAHVGNIKLYAGETLLDTISASFNIESAKEDPYEIDGFENYSGVDSLLTKKWAANKASGCTINLSLVNENNKRCSGDYGLKFDYNEIATSNDSGWAGATISKEVDWSDCNALQFWTIPDGKNQKVVIQITAGGKEYEAWLNSYEGYKDKTTPLLVTIPFAEFKDRDNDGPAGGLEALKANIQSFGLWVNTIVNEETQDKIENGMVSGTIYYDKITAVHTDSETAVFGNVSVSDISDVSAAAYLIGEKTGNVYYEVLPAAEAAPQDGAAIEQAAYGTAAIEENQTITVNLTNLTANTAYKLYAATKYSDIEYTAVQSIDFVTKKQSQEPLTIQGIPDGAISYGDSFALTVAGGTGDGAVSYKVISGSDYASVDADGNVTITGVGKVVIEAVKAGGDTYEAATEKVNFKTVKADQEPLAITNLPQQVRIDDTYTLVTTGGSGTGNVTYKITDGAEYAAIDSRTGELSVTGIGTVTVKATKALDKNYNKAVATAAFTSVKKEQQALKITGAPASPVYGDTFTLGTTGGSGNGTVSYAVTEGAAYASVDATAGRVTITGVGRVTITATRQGDAAYENCTAAVTFTTSKAAQKSLTISGVKKNEKVKADRSVTIQAQGGSSTGAVSYKVTAGSKYAKIDSKTGKLTFTGAGNVTVTAVKAGGANYTDASASVSFTAVKTAQKSLSISGVKNNARIGAEKALVIKAKGGSGSGRISYKVTGGSKYAKIDSKTGKVTITGIGKVTVTATKAADATHNAVSAKVTFTTKVPAKNVKVTAGSLKYQVTKSSAKSGTVTCYAPKSKSQTGVSIPSVVKIGGISFKVTAVSKNAFKNCKKLKTVTIGSNVTKIGDSAFYGDSKLKTITIKSKKLTGAGKNAFRGINSKAVIKVPSSKLKSYTKLLKKAGIGKAVKIRK